ncbi:unnamed protein product [Ixodes persulcatus]
MKLMRGGDLDYFKKFYRMTPQEYDYVLKLVEDDLRRSYVCREPISASERLAMTLRYLSSGDPVKDVALAFRVGISTARAAIVDTCKSLWERLRPIYMPTPNTQVWQDIAMEFQRLWQFPNCVGAVDGKHVQMQAPVRSGSLYFNYKKTHSIVLMASADAHYCFTIVDVGAYGRNSDGGVLKNSNFGIAMEKGLLKVPGLKLLPASDVVAPHVFIGDEAFQLRDDFMRPYPGQNLENAKDNFNRRLSRARRCVENAFGILSSRWRIFRRPLAESPKNAELLVLAACVLHNYLTSKAGQEDSFYCPHGYGDHVTPTGTVIDGAWRTEQEDSGLTPLGCTHARNPAESAKAVRELFTAYFLSAPGQLPWKKTQP